MLTSITLVNWEGKYLCVKIYRNVIDGCKSTYVTAIPTSVMRWGFMGVKWEQYYRIICCNFYSTCTVGTRQLWLLCWQHYHLYDSWFAGCGGVFNSLTGNISTQNYPLPYPNNIECIWDIIVPDGYHINIAPDGIVDIETGGSGGSSCFYDYVQFFNVDSNGEAVSSTSNVWYLLSWLESDIGQH